VGSGRKPPLWLNDGDIVEVSLEAVGTCVNQVQLEEMGPKI
jgi:2-keto-4-pentenoate hydratase/2-oxohepta-3-ene-1,7-dioic acid hydratase in catechol pathway